MLDSHFNISKIALFYKKYIENKSILSLKSCDIHEANCIGILNINTQNTNGYNICSVC